MLTFVMETSKLVRWQQLLIRADTAFPVMFSHPHKPIVRSWGQCLAIVWQGINDVQCSMTLEIDGITTQAELCCCFPTFFIRDTFKFKQCMRSDTRNHRKGEGLLWNFFGVLRYSTRKIIWQSHLNVIWRSWKGENLILTWSLYAVLISTNDWAQSRDHFQQNTDSYKLHVL